MVAILHTIKRLLDAKYAGFNRGILIKIEKHVNLLANQINRELQYEMAFSKYERAVTEDERIVAVDGVKLNTPIKRSKPIEPRKNYLQAEREDIRGCTILIKYISANIKLFKLEILEKEYEGINLEINQDQEFLKATIREFRFNPALNESLDKISQHLHGAKDEFEFKASIDLIRAFLNELCVSIACEIERVTKIKHSEVIKKMGAALAYFNDKRIKFLSESEFEFLSKFNKFISDRGVHSLKSEKEYARIARNFVVEFGLFLVKRLEKYIDDFKNNQPS